MPRRLISIVILLAPISVNAAALPIDGKYGSELGCRVAMTGEYIESNDTYLLTPESVGTSVSYCAFNSVTSAPGGRHVVSMTCSSEGSGPEGDTQEIAEISGDSVTGYTVRFADGTFWGPLTKC